MNMIKKCELLNNEEAFNRLLENIDTCVLWNVGEIFPGVKDFINKLRQKGKKVLCATNNSSKKRAEYLTKINNFGKKVYLIGSASFKSSLEEAGIKVISSGPEQLEGDIPQWAETPIDSEVEGVIVGFDKTFNFWKCLRAVSYLKNQKHLFIATNTDERFPYPSKNVIIPGTGSIVACVTTAAERQPWIAGKPCSPIFDLMIEEHKLDKSRTLFFGDRLNTDILGANRNGMKSMLVLSGVTSNEDLESVKHNQDGKNKCVQSSGLENPGELLPDFYADSIDALNKLFH